MGNHNTAHLSTRVPVTLVGAVPYWNSGSLVDYTGRNRTIIYLCSSANLMLYYPIRTHTAVIGHRLSTLASAPALRQVQTAFDL